MTKQECGEWLDINLLVVPDQVQICLLGNDDGALNKALAV